MSCYCLSFIKVHFRGLADGAQRRSMQGASTATSNYPVPEVPVYLNQLGDLSLFHDKPLLTVSSTFKAAEDYKEFLKGRESNQHLRNECAKEHCA